MALITNTLSVARWKAKFQSMTRLRSPTPVVVVRSSPGAARIAGAMTRIPGLDKDTLAVLASVTAEVSRNLEPYPEPHYPTVAAHFSSASSSLPKLSMLSALVRLSRAKSILEIGTGYGLSAIAMAKAQTRPGLLTIDQYEPQVTISRKHLAAIFPDDNVKLVAGDKRDIVPRLARDGRRFDLIFHDGGHDGDAYVRDFEALLPTLNAGGLFLIDDIRWDDEPTRRARTPHSRRTCYEGWREVASHNRVLGAVEIGGRLGILTFV